MDLMTQVEDCEACKAAHQLDGVRTVAKDERFFLYVDVHCPHCRVDRIFFFTIEQLMTNVEVLDKKNPSPECEPESDENKLDDKYEGWTIN